MEILRRAKRAMVKTICGVKLIDRKNMDKLIEMLGLKEMVDKLAKAIGVRWYGHVLRRQEDDVLRKALILGLRCC